MGGALGNHGRVFDFCRNRHRLLFYQVPRYDRGSGGHHDRQSSLRSGGALRRADRHALRKGQRARRTGRAHRRAAQCRGATGRGAPLGASSRRRYARAAALAASPWLDGEYALGELQSAFAEFQSRCRDYRHYLATDNIARKKELLREQIAKNREYYAKLERQRSLLLQDLDYGRRTLERDSLLLAEAVISAADYETTAQNYLSKQNTKAGFDATLTSTELQIIQSEQQLVELTLQQENETAEYERTLEQSRQQLAAQIAQWRQQYVLEAPVAGRVTLVNYWSENQHVAVGDKLASIVPDGATEVIGRLQVPSAGFGKVKVGQGVNVKLNGYPYMEFGVLRGRIRSLSAVPEQIQTQSGTTIAYTAEVVFPDGMTTSYKRELPMIQRMDGTAEIVTEDMRLIERFIQPVVSLFKNR